jgi:hypothetical protein
MGATNQETAVKNKINRIFKDDRLQAEYEKRMITELRKALTPEQDAKLKKVQELSMKFFANAKSMTKGDALLINKTT